MDANCNSKLKQFFKNSVNLIRVQILLVDCEKTALQKTISLLRIPRLITVQNKEDFSALIPK